jgi:hypothetical protein
LRFSIFTIGPQQDCGGDVEGKPAVGTRPFAVLYQLVTMTAVVREKVVTREEIGVNPGEI